MRILCIVKGKTIGLPDEKMDCISTDGEYFPTIDETHCNPETPLKLKFEVENLNLFKILIKRSTQITFNGVSIFPFDTFFNTPLLPKHTREVIYEGVFDSCNATASTTSIILRVKSVKAKGRAKIHGGCKCTHLLFLFHLSF